ncbi:MAG: ribosome maturation factor RimM [Solobacterium sp.]|nr:ribosome maturation factor RimM [Solobacterium sp.]
MAYIEIGRAVNTHGLKGELKIESWSDFDEIRYQTGNTITLTNEEEYHSFTVRSYRPHKGYALVAFEELPDINAVEPYKGWIVCIDEKDRPDLPEGEYYFDQLIGLMVEDEDGRHIGQVIAVEETNGAQDNLRVERPGNSDALIPNIPEFVKHVDLEVKVITIHVIEGLL